MRKLKLDAETLQVETFPASEPLEAQRGTVRAQGYSELPCEPCPTDGGSCFPRETEAEACPHSAYPCYQTHYNWYTCGVSCWYECLLPTT